MTVAGDDDGKVPSEEDYAAADKVLAARADAPRPGSKEYTWEREGIAISHSIYSKDAFRLPNRLREPRTEAERILVMSLTEGWPPEEFNRRLRAHIERPVDSLMIEEVSEAKVRSLVDLGRFLQTVIDCATKGWPPARVVRAEVIAGKLIDRLGRRRLFKEELLTACNYFEGVRNSLEPVRCGTFTGTSAHEVCIRVTNHVVELWRRLSEIAARSRQPGPYTHATTASELFYRQIERDAIPRPNELLALLELERRHAMRALARVSEQDRASAPDRTIRAGLVHIETEHLNVTTTRAPDKVVHGPDAGMPANEARAKAEQIVRKAGGVFPGRNELQRQVGCAPATMSKAIQGSVYLKARMAEHEERKQARRELRVTTGGSRQLDEIADGRSEDDPSPETVDEAQERLIGEQRSEEEREDHQHLSNRRWSRKGTRRGGR